MTDLNVDELTPPLELVQYWLKVWYDDLPSPRPELDVWMATQAARWGANQARAALAESQSAADGEVAELAKWLRANSSGVYRPCRDAADLLERLSATGKFNLQVQLIRRGTPNLAETRSSLEPTPVSERLPEANTKVLAHYFNALGKGRTVCAIWVPAKSRSEDFDLSDDGFTEYDEEDDKFYWPEGWYEVIENWDELGWVQVNEGEIAYWQPLPKWPAHALPLPSGEGEA